jgi:hypothetical protein
LRIDSDMPFEPLEAPPKKEAWLVVLILPGKETLPVSSVELASASNLAMTVNLFPKLLTKKFDTGGGSSIHSASFTINSMISLPNSLHRSIF